MRIVIAGLVAAASAAGTAHADDAAPAPAPVAIQDLGQPGKRSAAPQPAVRAVDAGACSMPYSAAQANGGPSPCAWPAIATDAWGPSLEIAGGDTLELRAPSGVVTGISASSTTNQSLISAPDGTLITNDDWFGPLAATPTSDPAVWELALPSPVPLRFLGASGGTLALLVQSPTGTEAERVKLVTPRADVYGQACGTYYGDPNVLAASNRPCGTIIPPGLPPGSPGSSGPTTVAPGPGAAAAKPTIALTHARRTGSKLRVSVTSSAAGSLETRARIAGRIYRATHAVKAGTTSITLAIPRQRSGRLTVRVSLTATSGTATASTSLRWRDRDRDRDRER